ncbi:ZYBA0S05-01992g1_1 [Zygosaccharomyces bailii CLIB 213]|uniref:ZYBA0S05-01992g1_1 n=1 Tax=Zygosaccharomyces bailii (strain CLIB 213 / ATCC 58445 / CBS 680 / BCRC 21525 / NBRC 1098 / NCYC 1416 / NRRL Y-2227) TaxID=1333698 RepID=A0A8J2T7V8_ZYGB2|nr:ZYBA0S05-01992g1_1 [Zygosaccharomyces bailii CLIB 213]
MLGMRRFSQCGLQSIKKHKLPPRPKFTPLMETECEEKFLHGGRGPGGQKINKCNSKVQLKHIPSGIVIECQQTRSRDQNRKLAREKMALEIERFSTPGQRTTLREEALRQWQQQGKKSKEKKSKLKHEQHRQEKELRELEKLRKEQEVLKSIVG